MPLNRKNSFEYKFTQIGGQIWMAEDLSVDHFRNGDHILEAKTNVDWKIANLRKQPAYRLIDQDSGDHPGAARVYNLFALSDERGLIPEGWHLPSDKEWLSFKETLGDSWQLKLKSSQSLDGGKLSKFSGYCSEFNLGGELYCDSEGDLIEMAEGVAWWSTFITEWEENFVDVDSGETISMVRAERGWRMFDLGNALDANHDFSLCGFSVRCVMDPVQTLLLNYGVTELSELIAISSEDAKILVNEFDGDLNLTGLTSISDEVANVFSQYGYSRDIRLDGITDLSDNAAKALAQSNFYRIYLNGLTSLSEDAAGSLSECGCARLCLDGLVNLSDAAAGALGQSKSNRLFLNGLKNLSDTAITELIQYSGELLSLNGLPELTEHAAKALSHFNGNELYLNGLIELNENVAGALSQFKGNRLYLNGLPQLTKQAAQGLCQFNGEELHLNGVTNLENETAFVLSKFRAKDLWVLGLSTLSDESAKALTTCNNIWFSESINLSDDGLRALSKQIKASRNRFLKSTLLERIAEHFKGFDDSGDFTIYFDGFGDEFGSFHEIRVLDDEGDVLQGNWELTDEDQSLLFKIIDAAGCEYDFNDLGTNGKIEYTDGKLYVETEIKNGYFGVVNWEEE